MSALRRDEGQTSQLARTAASGDRGAMEALYRGHAVAVARWVRALTCGQQGIEDLVHEVFVVAFTRLGTYDERLAFGAWLHGIAVNVVRNHRRKEGRRRRLRDRFSPVDERVATGADEELQGRRLARSLWRAVDGLSDARREAFVLRIIERRSLEECAQMLSVSIKTVSRRAIEAERIVRRAIEEEKS